jgi:DNA-binding transcriptional LysR family regulator
MPNWDDMRYLLAVARGGSMTAAADQLSTNPATVSRRMQNLTDDLGFSPLVKTPDGWKVNPLVNALLQAAEDFDHSMRASKSAAAVDTATTITSIKVGCGPVYSSSVVIPRMPELRRSLPNISLSFHTRLTGEGLGEYDLIITNAAPLKGRLIRKKLKSVAYGIMGFHPIDPAQDWVGLCDALDDDPAMKMAASYFDRPPIICFTHFDQVRASMLTSGLPGLLPVSFSKASAPFHLLEDPSKQMIFDRWLCYHESRRGDENLEAFVKWLVAADREAGD